jgi:pilus assembly protein CpaB
MQSRVLAILIAVVLALVATAAMVVYVNGADRRALEGQEPVRVLVANKTIPFGMKGEDALNTDGMIDEVEVPAKYALPGRVRSREQLRNRSAAADIVPGEQLLLGRWVGAEDIPGRRLLPIPEGYQAVPIGVDVVRQVAGFVTPGDRVNVFVTMPVGDQAEKGDKTQYVLRAVRVLAVGATALTRNSTQANGGRVNQGKGSQTLTAVTLAVKDSDVRKTIFAAEKGSIYMTLLSPTAGEPTGQQGPAADENDIFGRP